MAKLSSLLVAGLIAASFTPTTFAVEPENTDAATVQAACEVYTGPKHARCLSRAAVIIKRYPKIMKNLEKTRLKSSAERRAERMQKRAK